MEYKKIEGHAYNIHVINTDKFKKNMLRINFRGKLEKDDIVKRKMITSILLDSNSIYKTKRLLDIKTEYLYNLEGYSATSISGNSLITSFTISFLNDKYCNENILEESIKFERDLILKPEITNSRFNKKAFNKARNIIIEDINSLKENPKKYAINKALEEMDNGYFSYRDAGYLESLEKIDEKNLYEYYLNMIKTNKLDIFVIGDFTNVDVVSIIKKNFEINTIKKIKITPFITHTRYKSRYRKVIEEFNCNQSTLILGHKIEKMSDFERQYVLPIYSYILGGGPDSKLFRNVREKHSLCYSITANPRPVSSSLLVISGIDSKDYKKASKIIKKEISNMNAGDFTESDITKAKAIYKSAYKEILDSQSSIINKYISHEYLNFDLIEDNIKNIDKVDKKMILSLASKIHPDVLYLLQGEENEKE